MDKTQKELIAKLRYASRYENLNVRVIENGDSYKVGVELRKGDIIDRNLMMTLNNTLKTKFARIIKAEKLPKGEEMALDLSEELVL